AAGGWFPRACAGASGRGGSWAIGAETGGSLGHAAEEGDVAIARDGDIGDHQIQVPVVEHPSQTERKVECVGGAIRSILAGGVECASPDSPTGFRTSVFHSV